MNLQYNDDSRPMRLSAAYAHSGHCGKRRRQSENRRFPSCSNGWGHDIWPAKSNCPDDGRYLGTLSALVVELAAGRFQGGLMDVKNSSHQTKCHLLIKSATDETPAEAMLPPQKSRF